MKHPFKIDIGPNQAMHTFDLCVMVGGFKTAKEAEEFAAHLAEFLAEGGGEKQRVAFDA